MDKYAFVPRFFGVFVNPFYFARKGLYKNMKKLSKHINGGKLLDVGCGTKPYRHLFNVDQYDGLEYSSERYKNSKSIEYFYDGHKFPFDDSTYDNMICNEVLEHIFNPEEFLYEINRCLKLGGGD